MNRKLRIEDLEGGSYNDKWAYIIQTVDTWGERTRYHVQVYRRGQDSSPTYDEKHLYNSLTAAKAAIPSLIQEAEAAVR
jgi:hypothetical protein